ncbi:hypothetical protein ANN_19236 [Periplaneta americana]|uniref:Nuclease HARBI1 n=1 Tax=Periplaneta americana TaxID=6978 RepID=A0ABQ8S9A7_PERAM|nr:hypothetical protein ANN_19236 [Periplaneta americana]
MPNIIVATAVLHNIAIAARENLPPEDPEGCNQQTFYVKLVFLVQKFMLRFCGICNGVCSRNLPLSTFFHGLRGMTLQEIEVLVLEKEFYCHPYEIFIC